MYGICGFISTPWIQQLIQISKTCLYYSCWDLLTRLTSFYLLTVQLKCGDPSWQLCMNSYSVEIRENKMIGVEIIGISLTIVYEFLQCGNNTHLENEGSQSSLDVFDSTTSTSKLVPIEDWKALVNCLTPQRMIITIVMINKSYKEAIEQYYLQHLQVHFVMQRDTKFWFLL